MRKPIYYCLYKGDDVKAIGTKKELAAYLDVSIRTIEFYASPTYRKRNKKGNCYIVIKIEEDKDE